ncbi:putative RNA polymerase sigma factor FecI [mine drainage metagenome]|uniref:Putative RNA polymerase sigma factor FecI n=1 Tax=mine drainage metagenome TaxID=410659 RepID=A0A1J5TFL8_9ZZZZ
MSSCLALNSPSRLPFPPNPCGEQSDGGPLEPFPGMADTEESPGRFAALYRKTLAPLRRYLARLLGNSDEAADVAHDAYLRIYRSVEQHDAREPEALLYTTARRLAINRLKRRSISPISPETPKPDFTASREPGVEHQVMARQEWAILEKAITNLPQGCRSVLLLRKIDLLSHREIADRLGIAVSTVEKQHARALRLLKAALESALDQPAGDDQQRRNKEARP